MTKEKQKEITLATHEETLKDGTRLRTVYVRDASTQKLLRAVKLIGKIGIIITILLAIIIYKFEVNNQLAPFLTCFFTSLMG